MVSIHPWKEIRLLTSEITYHLSNMAAYFLFLIFNRTQAGRREGAKLRQHVQVHKARCIVRSPWKGTMREARANFNRLSHSTWESRMREASSFSRGRDQHVPLSLTLSLSRFLEKFDISCVTFFFLCRSHPPARSSFLMNYRMRIMLLLTTASTRSAIPSIRKLG